MAAGAGGQAIARPDGVRWSAERRTAFLQHLAATSNVRASERAAGMRLRAAYTERACNPAFRVAWDQALREGYARLEVELLDRALNGQRKARRNPKGEITGYDMEYSEKLALTLLSAHRQAVKGGGASENDPHAVRQRLQAKIEAVRKRLGDA